MTSSASSSTKNPPKKIPRTNVIGLSSNESSPIQQNNPIPITLDTTLALTITPPMFSQITPTQPIETSPLAPRVLIFSTSPSSPIEPHPYLTSMEDLLLEVPIHYLCHLIKALPKHSLNLLPWTLNHSSHQSTSPGEEVG
ncbi:hypothetical protein Tco_1142865 [Tanacetum coccineum]